ncbi:hypothetical protein [Poseidonocella sp. HB161398]|uniref:hypothetical protein n=1 Tax=Poseidonocella sp. HB161398 TaxID=2320855 RepID=UPI0011099B9D|nr:hypothetical protein [Poseidonocella sp. HB161398]
MPGTLRLLLPALLPSWRFFSGVGPSPRIEIREAGGLWQEAVPLPPRLPLAAMLRRLAWNPRWNARLYLVSLSERLAEAPDPHAEAELRTRLLAGRTGDWQVRLVFVSRKGEALERQTLWSSGTP